MPEKVQCFKINISVFKFEKKPAKKKMLWYWQF